MAGDVDICNMALSHLGATALVASIDPPDGSAEAGYCAQFYNTARAEALESAKWTWCKTRVALSQVANPSSVWLYAYALPSDCLKAMRVLQLQYAQTLLFWPYQNVVTYDDMRVWDEHASADFEIEGQVLLTNEPDAVLLYTRNVTDTTRFSPTFRTFLSYLLASYLAGPILRGREGAQTAGQMRQIARTVRGEASALDANASSTSADFTPSHIRARS